MDRKKLEQRLKDKLVWLNKYQEQIPLWAKMSQMTRILEQQLKILGLNRQSAQQFSRTLSAIAIPQSLEPFKQKIFNYLETEISLIEDNRTVLATSDVIESIFGKYKCFSQRCPFKELRSMVLTIPLATMKLTTDVIKTALVLTVFKGTTRGTTTGTTKLILSRLTGQRGRQPKKPDR